MQEHEHVYAVDAAGAITCWCGAGLADTMTEEMELRCVECEQRFWGSGDRWLCDQCQVELGMHEEVLDGPG